MSDAITVDECVIHTLANGMTVLVQPMPWLRTAAFSLSMAAGTESEPDDRPGLASIVCEMVQRGAGSHSSRDLVAIQDALGIDRSSGVSNRLTSFNAAMPADSLHKAMELYADVARRPHLPADQLDDARMMAMQELRAIEDEPASKVMRRVRQLQYGERLGRSAGGTIDGLGQIAQDDVRDYFTGHYHAGQSILAVAGKVDASRVIDWAEQLFGDWKTGTAKPPMTPDGHPAREHIAADSNQTHLGFSFDSLPYGHDDYFAMRAGIGILGDGMSSRLFDRVREQRGLCYTVSLSCNSLKQTAGVFGYAGTTPPRAQETLDVTLREIRNLTDDLQQAELDRWKVRIQSNLIMEQESSSSRASSLVSDWYQLGRLMSLRQLESEIESLTLDQIRQYYQDHPPGRFRIVVLGPDDLQVEANDT
ncbi:M16 family metallopeptidase [Crateriforma conspicua]|uniref:Peptidase M16 inactive domain protein n=1 Tax=Crateriforma conspicua TaxID=2527996 RepID=A0A5C5YAM6_9PLAN|nr:pitrilysin family protein [Crateriforma conspicua]TWT71988.1 Peptidase M16 inactive domain protein [Crateriforma conspicua]